MSKPPSNARTITFVVILCFCCALILAVMATALAGRQERSRQLDLSKQILNGARIYDRATKTFLVKTEDGTYVPAVFDEATDLLAPSDKKEIASATDIYKIAKERLIPMLTDGSGDIFTFKEAGIDPDTYIQENRKKGYAELEKKLFYIILPNEKDPKVDDLSGYVIPINGFGLWGPIYAYLALEPDADTVIGVTWDAPMETPGLGANIQDPSFENQFIGKDIFLPSVSGETQFQTARLGMIVVKGKVSDVFRDKPQAMIAVDGITGATITGDGATLALRKSLAQYRNFLLKAHEAFENKTPLIGS